MCSRKKSYFPLNSDRYHKAAAIVIKFHIVIKYPHNNRNKGIAEGVGKSYFLEITNRGKVNLKKPTRTTFMYKSK